MQQSRLSFCRAWVAQWFSIIFLLAGFACASLGHARESSQQRLVSLSPIQTENIFLLQAGAQLVGNTTYCVKPPQAKTIAKVGSVMECSIEKIIALRPDLVLASNLTPKRQIEALRRLGLQVEVFPHAASFEEICAQFMRLGKLLGRGDLAGEVLRQARQRVREASLAAAAFPPQTVLLQVGVNPIFASVPSSFTNDYIRLARGINIAAGRHSGAMTREEVLALDPQLIFIAVMGSQQGIAAEEAKTWRAFSFMRAARQGRIHLLNPDVVCSPSPLSFALALEQIVELMRPSGPRDEIKPRY